MNRPHLKRDGTGSDMAGHCLTIDVEDYFHVVAMSEVVKLSDWDRMPCRVEANLRRLLDLLGQAGVRTTCFFLGWVAERYPHLVREAVAGGHEVACHSYWHQPVYRLTREQFLEDTKRAKAVIEDAGGVPVAGYRAPSFSITREAQWAYPVLAGLGFAYSSSVHPIRHDIASNAGASRTPYQPVPGLWEIPVATVQTCWGTLPMAGGAYWRILPFGYTRWAIRAWEKEQAQPGVFYLHPWEIDPDQPRLPARLRSRLRHYTGLHGMTGRLQRLLGSVSGGPMLECLPALQEAVRAAHHAGGMTR